MGKIAVIGGGAAGFFAALSAKEAGETHQVVIFEKSSKVLSKVKVSGGGRCNVTNACSDIGELSKHYPRGERFLKKSFHEFNTTHTIQWFEERGVPLKTYPDNCIFPVANDSRVVIDCFLKESTRLGVEIRYSSGIDTIQSIDGKFQLNGPNVDEVVDRVIVTIGGQPKLAGLNWLANLGHTIIDPVPSLFTFNMPNETIRELMGTVVEETTVKIEGTKLMGKGALLITHWGMSGPAILQLSAWGARILKEKGYEYNALVNWLDACNPEELAMLLAETKQNQAEKKVYNAHPFPLSNRLWKFLLERAGINDSIKWKELGPKQQNRLVNTLLNDSYQVIGKTTFKEEFVTAGGVDLAEIDHQSMESKIRKGIYFAGEVMDIDGITGGFNFQSAWTTGYIAGKNAGISLD